MSRLYLGMLALVAASAALAGPPLLSQPATGDVATRTDASMPLSTPWRRTVYAYARENLAHPAWGWRHSERDYLLALAIARQERLTIDDDVLFAAAFLHDAGAIRPFAREGVDHAERSVELAESILSGAGFPMEKFPAVRSAILGHMYDEDPGPLPVSIVLHDADTLDFLGATGVARRLAVTGAAADLDGGVALIQSFSDELGARLITRAARRMARERIRTMNRFLEQLRLETPPGAKL